MFLLSALNSSGRITIREQQLIPVQVVFNVGIRQSNSDQLPQPLSGERANIKWPTMPLNHYWLKLAAGMPAFIPAFFR